MIPIAPQKLLHIMLIMCILPVMIDGFSLRGKQRLKHSLSNRIGENGGSGFLSIVDMIYNAYKYTTNLLNIQPKNQNNARYYNLGSEAMSGVPGCKDCFWGLHVERREAMVVSFR